jgi:uncharacterized protein
MPTMVFLNLPVADLDRSRAFFTSLGFSVNEDFSDDTAICVVISDTIYAMLLTHARFADFTDRTIADAATIEVINSLTVDSREEVDRLGDVALASGGAPNRDPEDLGFMYQRSFLDPDGHAWELVWMDPVAAEQGPPQD